MKPTTNDCDTFEMHHAMGSIDCQGEEDGGHNPKPASQVNGCQSPASQPFQRSTGAGENVEFDFMGDQLDVPLPGTRIQLFRVRQPFGLVCVVTAADGRVRRSFRHGQTLSHEVRSWVAAVAYESHNEWGLGQPRARRGAAGGQLHPTLLGLLRAMEADAEVTGCGQGYCAATSLEVKHRTQAWAAAGYPHLPRAAAGQPEPQLGRYVDVDGTQGELIEFIGCYAFLPDNGAPRHLSKRTVHQLVPVAVQPRPPGRYRDTDGTEGTLSEFDAFANRYTLDADGATVVVSAGPHLWETGELPSDPEEATRAVLDLIRQERERQVSVEGWDPSHDDEHADGALGAAAACYADPNPLLQVLDDGRVVRAQADGGVRQVPVQWPWAPEWWKPTPDDRERELVKAGALIVAELERLRRARPTVGTNDLPDGMAAVVAELERLEQAGDDTPSLPDKLTFGVKVPVFDPLDYVVASAPDEPVRGPNGGQVESQHGPCDSGGMTVTDFLGTEQGIDLFQNTHQLAFVQKRLEAGEAKYGQPLRMDWPRAAEARDEELADAIAYSVAMRDTETAQALALLWAGAAEEPTLLAVQGEYQPGWWREALGELEHAAVQAVLEEHGPALDVACAFVVRALEVGKTRPGDLRAHHDALEALFDAVDDWDPDARVCEGCPNLATTSDADGIPLCPECVALQVEHEAREGGEVSK